MEVESSVRNRSVVHIFIVHRKQEKIQGVAFFTLIGRQNATLGKFEFLKTM